MCCFVVVVFRNKQYLQKAEKSLDSSGSFCNASNKTITLNRIRYP